METISFSYMDCSEDMGSMRCLGGAFVSPRKGTYSNHAPFNVRADGVAHSHGHDEHL